MWLCKENSFQGLPLDILTILSIGYIRSRSDGLPGKQRLLTPSLTYFYLFLLIFTSLRPREITIFFLFFCYLSTIPASPPVFPASNALLWLSSTACFGHNPAAKSSDPFFFAIYFSWTYIIFHIAYFNYGDAARQCAWKITFPWGLPQLQVRRANGLSIGVGLMSYRRKKTRCPAEKPSCSSCVRLNQPCLYTSISRSSRGGPSVCTKDLIIDWELTLSAGR